MHRKRTALAVMAAMFVIYTAAAQNPEKGEDRGKMIIFEVLDGDTVIMKIDGNRINVDLLGIDAPELGQRGGKDAHAALMAKALGAEVTIADSIEKQDRLTAMLFCGEENISLMMIEKGHAWAVGDNTKFAEAQKEARAKKLGVWTSSMFEPTTPAEYRDKRRKEDPIRLAKAVEKVKFSSVHVRKRIAYLKKAIKKYSYARDRKDAAGLLKELYVEYQPMLAKARVKAAAKKAVEEKKASDRRKREFAAAIAANRRRKSRTSSRRSSGLSSAAEAEARALGAEAFGVDPSRISVRRTK